ncbi:M56 family metallopeptidase [Actinocorallia sp. A-T 12471]|uniref:M56 family metallopeptidase n=1 Tax=Actinocorallia sp. A-T 12471 TaxID=3089813 RepID=UPI0029D067EC|nr:M56 family metallopeptidase [Actinocorallia sp. A-T 12471]MDX6738300.1 M56 family metallopeptidase [Actinocorallia sp. A-T 12471]
MSTWVALTIIALATVPAAELLSRAKWTWRTPRTGILLWQALGLAWGLASIGALVGFALAPLGRGVLHGLFLLPDDGLHLSLPRQLALLAGMALTGSLIGSLLLSGFRVVRARARHRALLRLIADRGRRKGALVVDHPDAAAYCVPGMRSKIVISAGTLELLDDGELEAVLAHELAHARERHDLVLLPFTSLPRIGFVGRILDSVALLIEMRADDRALRHRSPKELAKALLRFATAPSASAPSCALAVAHEGGAVMARVQRLLNPEPRPTLARSAALLCSLLLVLGPLGLWTLY